MRKLFAVGIAVLLAFAAGCDNDREEMERRRDKAEVQGVSAADKRAAIDNENKTYKQSRKEMEKLHDQVRKDMKWDLRHDTWHDHYPIIDGPPGTITNDPVEMPSQPTNSTVNNNGPPPPSNTTPITTGVTGTKKAVIVGINAYPGAGLKGCVNDAIDIRNFLKKTAAVTDATAMRDWCIKSLSFKEDEIVFLIDKDATTANILQACVWLSADTKPGDVRYFWYSGHGAEWAGSNTANQPDHQNQIICPVDFAWDEAHMIQDVQLHKIFATMPNGVIFNWGSDSCHSGDLSKDLLPPGRLARHYPGLPPPNVAANLAAVKLQRGISRRGLVAGELEVGYLSGCQYDEFSADTQDENGRPCGAMTNYFLKTMNGGYWDKPMTTVCAQMNKAMDEYKYDQHPQIEGSRKKKGWGQP